MKWLQITPEVRIAVYEKTPRLPEDSNKPLLRHKPWEKVTNPYQAIPNEELLDDLYKISGELNGN